MLNHQQTMETIVVTVTMACNYMQKKSLSGMWVGIMAGVWVHGR